MESFNETYDGQVELHKQVAILIPAIVSNFATYKGRAATDSGRSAYFDKVVQKFYRDCKELSKARVLVDDSYNHAIYLKIDINLPAHSGSHVNYFSADFHLGTVEARDFIFGFDYDETVKRCKDVTTTTQKELMDKRTELIDMKKKISDIKASVPTAFTTLMDVRYH